VVTSRQSPGARPADPAAQLVELGDAEPVGVRGHHHGGVGDVDADLDDRRGHEHVDLAGANARITGPCGPGGRRPCSISSRSPCSGPRRSSGHLLDGGRSALGVAVAAVAGLLACLVLVAADPRAHDVDLVALSTSSRTAPSAAPSRRLVDERHDGGLDRRAAGGSSVSVDVSRSPKTVIATVRGIGVAVITSTCGGCAGLVGQRGSLLDAEAVLLVDHDEAQVGERHLLLEQRVGADHDAGRRRTRVEQRLRRAAAPSSR
jgi:hypothetical protein